MLNQPVTQKQLDAFRHVDVGKVVGKCSEKVEIMEHEWMGILDNTCVIIASFWLKKWFEPVT